MENEIIIDLSGKDGNWYELINTLKSYLTGRGMSINEWLPIYSDMSNGDYDNLITVFKKHYPEAVLVNNPE